jgi:hypothetical protein
VPGGRLSPHVCSAKRPAETLRRDRNLPPVASEALAIFCCPSSSTFSPPPASASSYTRHPRLAFASPPRPPPHHPPLPRQPREALRASPACRPAPKNRNSGREVPAYWGSNRPWRTGRRTTMTTFLRSCSWVTLRSANPTSLAVHAQRVQPRVQINHWGRVRHQEHQGRRQGRQGPEHRREGEVPYQSSTTHSLPLSFLDFLVAPSARFVCQFLFRFFKDFDPFCTIIPSSFC